MKYLLFIAFFFISGLVSAQTLGSKNSGKNQDTLNSDEVFNFFAPVEEKAMFKGGNQAMYKFVGDSIVIPDSMLKNDYGSHTILVSFIVEKNGGITMIKIDQRSRRTHLALEESALNVVKKMDGMWTPAIKDDKPVRMRFSLPIRFTLH